MQICVNFVGLHEQMQDGLQVEEVQEGIRAEDGVVVQDGSQVCGT